MSMLPKLLEQDRKRAGWSVGRAAWELGVSIQEYRELEDGKRSPNWETFDRVCKLYGWPQTFVGSSSTPWLICGPRAVVHRFISVRQVPSTSRRSVLFRHTVAR